LPSARHSCQTQWQRWCPLQQVNQLYLKLLTIKKFLRVLPDLICVTACYKHDSIAALICEKISYAWRGTRKGRGSWNPGVQGIVSTLSSPTCYARIGSSKENWIETQVFHILTSLNTSRHHCNTKSTYPITMACT
jgi:hypothetical protein